MKKPLSILVWVVIAALGAAAFGIIALSRGETVSAAWLVIAGVSTYLVAYRFYSRYLAPCSAWTIGGRPRPNG